MTHSGGKPHEVGDRGQRYEVRAVGYPHKGEERVVAWTARLGAAISMAQSIRIAPGCTGSTVVDRKENLVFDPLMEAARVCREEYCRRVPGKRTWGDLTDAERKLDVDCLQAALAYLRGDD